VTLRVKPNLPFGLSSKGNESSAFKKRLNPSTPAEQFDMTSTKGDSKISKKSESVLGHQVGKF